MPVTVVLPLQATPGDFPLLIEAKSAGDFTNTNKRRKEEATKVAQLHSNYGEKIQFVLFLCGYFDSGYLGYEAAEGIELRWFPLKISKPGIAASRITKNYIEVNLWQKN